VPQLIVSELQTLLPPQVTRQIPASLHVTVSQSFCWVQLTSQRATPEGHVGSGRPLMMHPPSQPPLHAAGQGPLPSAGASVGASLDASGNVASPASLPLLPSLLPLLPLLLPLLEPVAPLLDVLLALPSTDEPTSRLSPTAEIPHAAATATSTRAATTTR